MDDSQCLDEEEEEAVEMPVPTPTNTSHLEGRSFVMRNGNYLIVITKFLKMGTQVCWAWCKLCWKKFNANSTTGATTLNITTINANKIGNRRERRVPWFLRGHHPPGKYL